MAEDVDQIFEDQGQLDLRDPKNRELKRIADRLTRYARDNFNRAVFVGIFADIIPDNQIVNLAVALPEEPIEEEAPKPKKTRKAKKSKAA